MAVVLIAEMLNVIGGVAAAAAAAGVQVLSLCALTSRCWCRIAGALVVACHLDRQRNRFAPASRPDDPPNRRLAEPSCR